MEKVKIIRDRLKAVQDRQEQWADLNSRLLEFETRDKVFLKISLTREVIRFDSQGKLSPRFIGLLEVLKQVGEVAYRLALPGSLDGVHDVFHFS